MKKSLTRKLFLSVAALAATAATLTSSTWAWYTGNSEAKVNSVTASTAADGESSIYISSVTSYGTGDATTWSKYSPEVTPMYTNGYIPGNPDTPSLKAPVLAPVYANRTEIALVQNGDTTLQPATDANSYVAINKTAPTPDTISYVAATGNYVAGTTYYTDNTGATEVDTSTFTAETSVSSYFVEKATKNADTVYYSAENNTATSSDFIEFVIRVRGTKVAANTKIYFNTFNLRNALLDEENATASSAAAKLPGQIALANDTDLGVDGATGVSAAGAYKADILKALKMDVYTKEVTLSGDTIPTALATNRTLTPVTYQFEGLSKVLADANITEDKANAVGYYNQVTNSDIAAPASSAYAVGTAVSETSTGKTPLVVATLNKDGATTVATAVVEIRFVLYLDGWDNYCYDVMQGQRINFDFSFTTNEQECCLYA